MPSHGGNSFNFLIVFVVALGSFTFGYSSAIVGAVFGLPSFFSYFSISLESDSSRVNTIVGAQNGVFFGGGFIGCILCMYLPDKIGRVRNIQFICILCLVGSIIQGASVHIAMLLVGRFFSGMGAGMANCSIPLYQSEVAPPKQRGRMVGLHGTMLAAGYALAGWSGYGCYFETNPNIQWRLLLCLQVISPTLLLAMTPWLPESPRWSILNDKMDEALHNLRKLHHTKDDPDDLMAREEFVQIQRQIALERSQPSTLWAMMKVPSYRRRLLTGIFLQFLGQSSGITVINNYSVLLYNQLGLEGSQTLLVYAFWVTLSCFANLLSSFIVDRFGRARLFKIGVSGSLFCLVMYTILIAVYSNTDNKAGSGACIFFVFLYLGWYGTTYDATSYIYCSEIFPSFMRATGVSFSVSGWLAAALVYNEVAATAFNRISWKYNLVFICITIVSIYPVFFLLPETKGLSLEEISRLFGDEVAVDLDHMTEEERKRLDDDLLQNNGKGAGLEVLAVDEVEKV